MKTSTSKAVAVAIDSRQCRLDCKTATIYLSDTCTVKATRRHKQDERYRHEEFVVSIGRPNYAEKKMVKDLLKAGVPFPVKKAQLKFWPKKRKAKK